MKKLNLYLNEDQYRKLCILAKEENYNTEEEYANEIFYTLLMLKWLRRQSKEAERILNDPNTDWEE